MKYEYGEEVLYTFAVGGIVTRKRCCVVAITPVETAKQAEVFGYSVGTIMYTVEFGDGSDKLVPEGDLGST
jgi:hypothetical protein